MSLTGYHAWSVGMDTLDSRTVFPAAGYHSNHAGNDRICRPQCCASSSKTKMAKVAENSTAFWVMAE